MTEGGKKTLGGLRSTMSFLARTPLHPQWLMTPPALPHQLVRCKGVVLDIGSAGKWLQRRIQPEANYVGIDYPTTAKALYGTSPDVYADAHKLPLADGTVDAVACFEVLEHVTDPERVLAEIERVLKRGGVAALSMPFLYPVHDAPYDYQRWTEHGWRRRLKAAGFVVDEIVPAVPGIHSAGVLAALALAGPLQAARWHTLIWTLPLVALLVPLINIGAWLLGFVWPRWTAMSAGVRIVASKAQ